MGCRALLRGIFPTQGSNQSLLRLLHWQAGSSITSAAWEAFQQIINSDIQSDLNRFSFRSCCWHVFYLRCGKPFMSPVWKMNGAQLRFSLLCVLTPVLSRVHFQPAEMNWVYRRKSLLRGHNFHLCGTGHFIILVVKEQGYSDFSEHKISCWQETRKFQFSRSEVETMHSYNILELLKV